MTVQRTFMAYTLEFQRAVFSGAETLLFVFENIIACPLLLNLACFQILHADNFALALEVEVCRLVVYPVCPVFS